MGANNPQESTQASREMLTYIRRLLGPTRAGSGVGGTRNVKLPITQSGGTGRAALTQGERASGGSKQLQAEAITKPSKSSSGSSGGFNIGNHWLLSPIAGVVNSVLGLFGVGSSTSQVTRYRAQTRQPFQIVEAISPETGAGVQTINESASGLFGVTSGSGPTAPGAAAVESRTDRTEGTTNQRGPQKQTGMAGSTASPVGRLKTSAHGIATPASGEGRSLMNDRQGLVSALRRSLGDSRGISDVLNEFQDGL